MMLDKGVFLDTNVLIYANNLASPFCAAARARLSELRASGVSIWISRQVMREYLAVMTRQGVFEQPLERSAVLADLERFEAQFRLADEGAAVFATLKRLVRETAVGGKQVHDANIVATMLANGIPTLLTGNVSDFKRFGDSIELVDVKT